MRGFKTVLVERKDLADGTTGRYHGLLHSGGRYAVKDPAAAEECIAENLILRRIASDCIEDTGGLFVSTPWDDPAFGDTFLAGCRAPAFRSRRSPSARRCAASRVSLRDLACIHRSGRSPRPLEARLGLRTLGAGAWGANPALPPGRRARARRPEGERCPRAQRADRGGPANPRGRRRQRSGRLGGADRRPRRLSGQRPPGQGDHDRDEPPAREHGGQPVQDAGGRGHPRPDPHGVRDRDDRHAGCRSGRPRGHPVRDRRDARRGREARPRLPGGAGASGLGRCAAALLGRGGGGHARREPLARARRPPRARRRRGPRDDHGRKGDDVPADGRGGGGRRLRTARGRASVPDAGGAASRLRGRALLRARRAAARTRASPAVGGDHLRVRADHAGAARGGDGAAADREPRRHPPYAAARNGPVPGRLLHLSGYGNPSRRRAARQPRANAALLAFLQERWKGVHPILYGDQVRQARLDDWIFQGLLGVQHLPT